MKKMGGYNMSLRAYEYFVAVAEAQHFSKAAERCHVSQPTLSVQLKKLEERLGVSLFERHPRRVVMTFAGQAVLPKARQMLRLENEISQIAQAAQNPLVGRYNLGIIPTIAPYLLPRLTPFQQENTPELVPALQESKTESLVTDLRAGTLDAAILALPLAGIDDLSVTPLYGETFYLALPEKHPLAARKVVSTDDLGEGELLLLEEGHCLRDHALEVCQLLGRAENVEFRASSLETLRHMVMAGQGVTLLPELALEAPAKGTVPTWPHLAIRPIKTSQGTLPQRQVGLVCRYGYPRAHALRHILTNFAKNLVGERAGLLLLEH